MIIHSIVPMDLICETPKPPESKCVKCDNGYVEVVNSASGWSVNRLISTDPAAYLNPIYTPGSKYDLKQ